MSRPGLFGRRLVAAAAVVVLISPGFLVEPMLRAASPQSGTPSSASEKSPTRIRYERIRVLANRLEAGQDVEAELAALVAEVQEAVDAAPSASAASDEAELDPQRRGEALSVYFGASALADSLRRSGERPRERFEHRARAFHAATVVASWSSAGRAAVELANAAIDAGDVALARPWLIRALDVLPADTPRRTDIASALAQVENFIGNWDEALRRLEEAEAALPLTHPQVDLLRARLAGFRGEVFLSMGLIDQCATWCEREWRVMRDVPDERAALRERARIHRMNLFLAAERFEEVVADLEPLLDGGSLDSLPSERAALRVRLGVALASLERADPDRDRRAVEVLQSVASDSDPAVATERTNAELRLVQTHLERDEFDQAERWLARIRERPAPSRLDQAFRDALETLLILKRRPDSDPDDRTRLERQSAALRTGFDSLVQAYDAVLDEWYELRLRQGGAGLLHYETVRFVLSVLIDTTLELDPTDEERALEPVLAGLRASTLARRLGVEPDHQRGEFPIASDDDPPIVLFLPAIEVTHVFWIDGEGVAHARAPSRPELERMRLPFVDTLTRSPFGLDAAAAEQRVDRLREQGARLFDALFEPSMRERLSRHERVTIAASDLLGYLPFEALVRDGEWLGSTIALGYTPSPDVATTLGNRADARDADETTRPAPRALIVAAPNVADPSLSHLPPLPFEAEQRALLTAPYSTDAVELLVGDDATLTRTTDAIERTPLVHFLVHGIHDYTKERTAGLVLAPEDDRADGIAWASDLDPLAAPPLVLLTACGTGRGPARWGDGSASHLGGTFLAAGADTVVLPVAELAYDATLRISAVLHERLAAGASPAEALREARDRVARRAEFADPFYFALLHAHGLPHRSVFAAGTPPADDRDRMSASTDSDGSPAPDATPSARPSRTIVILAGVVVLALAFVATGAAMQRRRRRANQKSKSSSGSSSSS